MMMRRYLHYMLASGFLLAQLQRSNLYDNNSNRVGTVTNDQRVINLYDPNSKRIGTGRIQPDGRVDLYTPDGQRLLRVSPPTTITPERSYDPQGPPRRRP